MKIKFGQVTSDEVDVMLEASASSGSAIAASIFDKRQAGNFELTTEEAIYLRDCLWNDADRVAESVSPAAGRAFEAAAQKLTQLLKTP